MRALLIALFMLVPMVAWGQAPKGIPPLYEADELPTCNANREGWLLRANADSNTGCSTAGSTVNICECVDSTWIDVKDVTPFRTLASGALSPNTVHLATAAADYDLPVCETANIGTWVTVIVRDVSEAVGVAPLTGDTIHATQAVLSTSHVLDSEASADNDGDFITLVCVTADNWYSIAMGGLWVDAGAP